MKKIVLLFLIFCMFSFGGCSFENYFDQKIFQPAETQPKQTENAPKTTENHVEQPVNDTEYNQTESEDILQPQQTDNKKIIVIDPGHGKPSSQMSDEEKKQSGFTYIEGKGWGDWRHFKSGTMWHDCQGSNCSGRAPNNGGCWYPIGYGDRDTEPDINFNNAQNAKKYLEQLGYTVRLTRSQNENPSLTKRLKSCYPDGDITKQPDALAYICLHSNAGGGSGSCYISLSGLYDHVNNPDDYIQTGNALGKAINDSIVMNTSLTSSGNGRYDSYPELVLFCKCPVTIGYMEIGFYDNPNDLNILKSQSDKIGKAIADGIHSYFSDKQ